jgi:hypothetical protein
MQPEDRKYDLGFEVVLAPEPGGADTGARRSSVASGNCGVRLKMAKTSMQTVL